MRDENCEPREYDERERAMFTALPRESAPPHHAEQRTVNALRHEGFFRRRAVSHSWVLQAAAAVALFAGGGLIGARYTARHSIETMLARKDLSLSDRVFLLQRAGSAYIQAANNYADATTRVDSGAVEVAQQVLLGAANAVARRRMDGGMTVRLARALQAPGASQ
jgi:hypothetical protein